MPMAIRVLAIMQHNAIQLIHTTKRLPVQLIIQIMREINIVSHSLVIFLNF